MERKGRNSQPGTSMQLAKDITERVTTCMRECGTEVSADAHRRCYETVMETLANEEGGPREVIEAPAGEHSETPRTTGGGDHLKELTALLQEAEESRRALEDDLTSVAARLTKSLKLASVAFESPEIESVARELDSLGRERPPQAAEIVHRADRLADLLFKHSLGDEPSQSAAASGDEASEREAELDHLNRELYRREIELTFERDRAEKLERVNAFLAETIREITRENERLEEVNLRVADLIAAVESGRIDEHELENLIGKIRNQISSIVRKFKEAMERTARRMFSLEEELAGARAEKEKKIAQLEQRLSASERRALTDDLTGIANRGWFDEAISSMIRNFDRRKPFSLLLIDIDHFKQVNDQHGHQFGDTVLKKLAAIARESFRRTDTVARYGGEEFAVVLPDVRPPEAVQLAEKLRTRVADTTFRYRLLKKKGKRLVQTNTVVECAVTISAGAATARSGDDVATLTRRADAALYLAKKSGRNTCRGEADLPSEEAAEEIGAS